MNEVIKTIEDTAINTEMEPPKDALHDLLEERRFRRAAITWAAHSLISYTGDALSAALKISQALADFANVMEIKQ